MFTAGRVALVFVIVALLGTVLWFGRHPRRTESSLDARVRRAVERAEVRRPYAVLAGVLATVPLVVAVGVGWPATTPGEIQFLLGSAAYLVGVALLAVGLSSRPAYTAVHRGGVDELRSVEPGYVAVAGVAAGGDVTSPLTGDRVCWYECRISGTRTPPGRIDVERGGEEFRVTGQAETVTVRTEHVQMREGVGTDEELVVESSESVPERLAPLVGDRSGPVRITESRIEPGDPVTVVGRFESDAGELRLAEEHELPAYVFAATRATVVDRLRARVLGMLPAGTILTAVGGITLWGSLAP